MKLRCKAGDLAMVIREEEPCRANVGKIVRIAGPVRPNERGQSTWLIQPVRRKPWWTLSIEGVPYQRFVTFASQVEHPDEWFLPLDPLTWTEDERVESKRLEAV